MAKKTRYIEHIQVHMKSERPPLKFYISQISGVPFTCHVLGFNLLKKKTIENLSDRCIPYITFKLWPHCYHISTPMLVDCDYSPCCLLVKP